MKTLVVESVKFRYYQRGGTLESVTSRGGGGGVGGSGVRGQLSDSDSVYTIESGVIRYHVITMRPRLGSDGGRSVSENPVTKSI